MSTPMAPSVFGNVHLGYGEADYDLVDAKAKSYSIAYTHALSKRTTLYAAYMRVSNDDNSSIEPPSRFNNTNAFTSGFGEKYNGVALGLRHAF